MTEPLEPFEEFILECGYLDGQIIGDQYVAIMPLLYTSAIIIGRADDYMIGYEDRWCYAKNPEHARQALREWLARGLEGEPDGWHRHPDSGRRRPDGDATKEYVNP